MKGQMIEPVMRSPRPNGSSELGTRAPKVTTVTDSGVFLRLPWRISGIFVRAFRDLAPFSSANDRGDVGISRDLHGNHVALVSKWLG